MLVGSDERQRLIDAIRALSGSWTSDALTVDWICEQAGLSHEAYGRHFTDLHDGIASAIEDALSRLSAVVRARVRRPAREGWKEQVGAAVAALLAGIDADRPSMAPVLVDSLRGDVGVRARSARQQFVAGLDDLLAPAASRGGRVGAIGPGRRLWELIQLDLARPERYPVSELIVVGVFATLAPAIGKSAAIRHALAARAAPRLRPAHQVDAVSNLAAATVTYLASYPGASNVEIGAGVGVRHESQASRHLWSLQRRGLIAVQRHGTYNAWALTELGWQIVDQLRGR